MGLSPLNSFPSPIVVGMRKKGNFLLSPPIKWEVKANIFRSKGRSLKRKMGVDVSEEKKPTEVKCHLKEKREEGRLGI